jgi:hypothetical protein
VLFRSNEAKSALKWVEAALTETPTVASPTAPYREVVVHDRNGMLAAGPDEWVEGVERLVVDVEHRNQVGRRGRRDALLELSPHLQGRRYLEILTGPPTDRIRPARATAWTPVVHDEPPEPVALTPYQVDTAPPDPPTEARPPDEGESRDGAQGRPPVERLPALVRSAATKARHSYKERGALATARRAMRSILRRATRAL